MILDLHNHTRWSFDCSMDPAKVVRTAKARGIDAIAITDHDEIQGAYEAQKAAAGDILVIIGEEIDTAAGDVLGLFLKERIVEHDPVAAIRAIHDQGGLAVLAHPFTKTKSVDEPVARLLDGCEGFNARHSEFGSYEGAEGEPRVASFAREYDLSVTAGSDAHFYRELARARTIVSAASLEDAKEQIRRG
ncbi:MAG: PHP domain-containing protein, partial [Planctomycetaceae bacterium]|nr:PHP domain-containing protein [Planctomycetaceae bacterium]